MLPASQKVTAASVRSQLLCGISAKIEEIPEDEALNRRLGQKICCHFGVSVNLFLPFHFFITLSG